MLKMCTSAVHRFFFMVFKLFFVFLQVLAISSSIFLFYLCIYFLGGEKSLLSEYLWHFRMCCIDSPKFFLKKNTQVKAFGDNG